MSQPSLLVITSVAAAIGLVTILVVVLIGHATTEYKRGYEDGVRDSRNGTRPSPLAPPLPPASGPSKPITPAPRTPLPRPVTPSGAKTQALRPISVPGIGPSAPRFGEERTPGEIEIDLLFAKVSNELRAKRILNEEAAFV